MSVFGQTGHWPMEKPLRPQDAGFRVPGPVIKLLFPVT